MFNSTLSFCAVDSKLAEPEEKKLDASAAVDEEGEGKEAAGEGKEEGEKEGLPVLPPPLAKSASYFFGEGASSSGMVRAACVCVCLVCVVVVAVRSLSIVRCFCIDRSRLLFFFVCFACAYLVFVQVRAFISSCIILRLLSKRSRRTTRSRVRAGETEMMTRRRRRERSHCLPLPYHCPLHSSHRCLAATCAASSNAVTATQRT